jgi:pyridoxamine 5'-phosphate oxidase
LELSDIRNDYGNFSLNETNMAVMPDHQLKLWLEDAAKNDIIDFNAMVLSTAGTDGRPSSRVVLLKDTTDNGELIFFTNYNSRKGSQIEENPSLALNFFWRTLERQVRVEGKVTKTSAELSDEYFNSRPKESRVGAIVSPQSQQIKSLDVLIKNAEKLLKKDHIKRPDNWGGFKVIPDYYEFWQGGKNRLHDRICYQLKGGKWVKARLAP